MSTNTRIATTKALVPGSISRAIRRSAASMSSRKASNALSPLIARTPVARPPRRVVRGGHPQPGTAGTPAGGVGVSGAGAAVAEEAIVGDEVMRRSAGDRRGDDVAGAHRLLARREMHQPPVTCPSTHPCGAVVFAAFSGGHQKFDGPADLVAVFLQRDLVLQRDESVIAFLHNDFRHLITEFGRGGAGPLGVLEGEGVGEAGLPDHIERRGEVLFGFAGETDDEVGGDRCVRHGRRTRSMMPR